MRTTIKENIDELFPDVRETGDTPLRQCQLVMLRMLKIFDHLCRKHNIEYFLTGGTLLGAIRHKGFIPWDDDSDIGMKRKDYERFVRLAAPELPNDIFFQNTDTDHFLPMYHIAEAKLRDKYSRYIRKPEIDEKLRWHNGIQIDIFIYDRAFLPSNMSLYYINHFFKKLFGNYRKINIRAKVLQAIEKLGPGNLVYASSYVHMRYMTKFGGCWKTKEELKKLVRVPFEDMEALVPVGWHTYLERMYGDYMTPPPKEKQRGVHGIDVADPFTPCNHKHILNWNDRKATSQKVAGY